MSNLSIMLRLKGQSIMVCKFLIKTAENVHKVQLFKTECSLRWFNDNTNQSVEE